MVAYTKGQGRLSFGISWVLQEILFVVHWVVMNHALRSASEMAMLCTSIINSMRVLFVSMHIVMIWT